MLEVIKEETQHPDNEDYGMHVTVLMSHGAHGVLYGTDIKPVKLLDVFDLLSSDNFKSMDGKPKVVIVVACRSAATDALIERVEAESGEISTCRNGVPSTLSHLLFFSSNVDCLNII
ncbi:CASP2 [Bugula neritina]|uniref:CASP2 n=1 Tax=Bugula neritina TaxID=10212 RepID=A0A7J7JJS5_BUGNE|nr:CASP2 [Bugula neritina]